MTDPETPVPADLDAYVDNQLDMAGRLRVERHLATSPDLAARVMADLEIRTTLKLALSGDGPSGRPATREAARRLASGLEGRRMWLALRRIAAVMLLVSTGWLANNVLNPFGPQAVNASTHPPAFVEEAVAAHKTALLREAMPSQPRAKSYDPDEIRAGTAIVMPVLPKDWRVVDVEVFPSGFGPSVETALETDDGRRVSLFAVRPGHFAVEPVQASRLSQAQAAWWQIGDVAYALVSDDADASLVARAETLKSTLY